MYKQGSRKGTVRFSLTTDGTAKQASLAGEFTSWQPVKMRKQKGVFAVTVPLGQGAHQYKFIVDGQWVADPENDQQASNEHGTTNSVAVV